MVALLTLASALAACRADSAPAAGPGVAEAAERVLELRAEVVSVRPHRRDAFTQGLLLAGGWLYESTGQYGSSTLRRVDPVAGEVDRLRELPRDLFGEGLERVGERLYQLTWYRQQALVYDLESFEPVDTLSYSGQGWGLCLHEGQLVRSAGTDRLFFHDVATFEVARAVEVTLRGEPLSQLNELECAEGWVYSNVWRSETIVRIDPSTGRVRARIDASGLLSAEERSAAGVLNGIAYDPEAGTFLLTGKNWPKLFEVIFVEADLEP